MNKYLLFAYDCFYPNGGVSDLKGVFNSHRDALDKVWEIEKASDFTYDHYQIYDMGSNEYKTFEIANGEILGVEEMNFS